MLDRQGADLYLDAVREAVLEALETADLEGDDPLLKDGFVYHMILQHECQHNETMLQTLQLVQGEGYRPETETELPEGDPADEMAHVQGCPFVMGTEDRAWALDHERGAHEVEVADFHLDKTPVPNLAYLEFVEDGGYEREALWRPEGWTWIRDQRISAPKHWYQREAHSWWTRRFGFDEPLRMGAPVVHVSFYEADASARWAGKRLPTEAEWEKAASWDPETGTKRLFPWGDAPPTEERTNLDQLAFRAADAGAYPAGASAYGVLGMFGDVWEWTASDFAAYPGFESFPTGSTQKSSSAPTTRFCAEAPGPPALAPSETPSATGTTRSDASSFVGSVVQSRHQATGFRFVPWRRSLASLSAHRAHRKR